MNSLLLDRTNWDLVIDAKGNIALAGDPYAAIQDVANAVRLFAGELWYDKTKGVPYWASILGLRPPLSFVKAQVVKAAMTVPRVVAARCVLASFRGRALTGQVQVKVDGYPPPNTGPVPIGGQIFAFSGSPLVTFDGYFIVSF